MPTKTAAQEYIAATQPMQPLDAANGLCGQCANYHGKKYFGIPLACLYQLEGLPAYVSSCPHYEARSL